MSTADVEFVYEAKPLAHWLPELVCDDLHRRSSAVQALSEMRLENIDSAAGRVDYESHWARFAVAVRAAVSSPLFDAPGFIGRLIDRMRKCQDERMRLWKVERDETERRIDRAVERLRNRMHPESDPGVQTRFNRRAGKVICANQRKDRESERIRGMLFSQEIMMLTVYRTLRECVLLAPDRARSMLRDRSHGYLILDAICEIGPGAKIFLPDLM